MDPQPKPIYYICGKCGLEVQLKPNDSMQCRDCGYHILYKKRARRSKSLYLFSTYFTKSHPLILFSLRRAEETHTELSAWQQMT
ncbi:hypothetical protein ACFX2A_014519 [Malus domestica]